MAEVVPSVCKNGTGVSASLLPAAEARINANESTVTGGLASGGSSAAPGTMSGTAASATASPTGGAEMLMAASGVMGIALLGAAALL